jgi:hypothetical protein
MKKQTYRMNRRHGPHAAGDELQLTEAEAQQIENEAPGAIDMTPLPAARSETRAEPKPAEAAKPAKDAT